LIVVADTTPLLYLSRIGRAGLLQTLYQDIIVPRTVWDEAVGARPGAPGIADLVAATWIRVSDEAERAGVDRLLEEALDPGEAAAITLAELLHADILLIDERKGQAVARERGLQIRGTLGVLVDARRAGHLASLRSVLQELLAEGFRVAPALVSEALRRVGEE
jgi:predicted nucleic acid-binding protein